MKNITEKDIDNAWDYRYEMETYAGMLGDDCQNREIVGALLMIAARLEWIYGELFDNLSK